VTPRYLVGDIIVAMADDLGNKVDVNTDGRGWAMV
jgi:hypothetical protein